jgi:hypothetical protein
VDASSTSRVTAVSGFRMFITRQLTRRTPQRHLQIGGLFVIG